MLSSDLSCVESVQLLSIALFLRCVLLCPQTSTHLFFFKVCHLLQKAKQKHSHESREHPPKEGTYFKKTPLEDVQFPLPDMVRFSCLENLLCQVEVLLPSFW